MRSPPSTQVCPTSNDLGPYKRHTGRGTDTQTGEEEEVVAGMRTQVQEWKQQEQPTKSLGIGPQSRAADG